MTEAVKPKKGVMSFLTSIGLAEEVPEAPVQRNTPVPGPPRNTPVPAAPYVQHYPAGQPLPIDPESLARLEARLQKSCPAPYTAFMEMYESLKEDISDDRQRFKVALKTSHTTSDQILAAIDQLLGVMGVAQAEFTHTFEENKSRQLGEAEASIKSTDDLIASNEQQLKAVQDTIASLRTKRETDIQAMQDKAHKIETIRANFEAAHQQVVGRLQAQKSRVETMPKV